MTYEILIAYRGGVAGRHELLHLRPLRDCEQRGHGKAQGLPHGRPRNGHSRGQGPLAHGEPEVRDDGAAHVGPGGRHSVGQPRCRASRASKS